MRRRTYLTAASTGIALASTGCLDSIGLGSSSGRAYPSETIDMWISTGKGGSLDLESRVVADYMENQFDASVAPQNVTGAGGGVCYQRMKDVAPDGYTVGTHLYPFPYVSTALLGDQFQYDAVEGFTPIIQFSRYPFSINVPYDSEIETLDDIVSMAEQEGRIKLGMSPLAVSAIPFLSLQSEAGVEYDLQPVFLRGGGNITTAIQAGRVDMGGGTLSKALQKQNEGILKPAIIFSEPRQELIDFYRDTMDVELTHDQFITEYSDTITPVKISAMRGMFGPHGLDQGKQQTLTDGLQSALTEESGWVDQMENLGSVPDVAGPETQQRNWEEARAQIEPHVPTLNEWLAENQ